MTIAYFFAYQSETLLVRRAWHLYAARARAAYHMRRVSCLLSEPSTYTAVLTSRLYVRDLPDASASYRPAYCKKGSL